MRIDKLKILRLFLPVALFFALILFLHFSFEREDPDMKLAVVEVQEEGFQPPEPAFDTCEIDKGGVVLMFDDLFVESWYKAHEEIFLKKDVKATFYLTRIFKLEDDNQALDKILEMQSFGHEMANHTMNHLRLNDFLLERTPQQYFENEVKEANVIAESLGLHFYSFAYRGGVGHPEVDEILLNNFKTVRYTSGRLSSDNDEIYYKDACSRILGSGSIDFSGISKEDISLSVQRADLENSVLIILGHKIVEEKPEEGGMYRLEYERLNHLIDEVYKRDMEFFTVSEVFSGESF